MKAQLYLYGSQSTGLCLEFSDVDLVVVVSAQSFELFDQIERAGVFKNSDLFRDVRYIGGASIPIIKFQMSSKYYGRKVDITFQTAFHNGLRCNSVLRQFL